MDLVFEPDRDSIRDKRSIILVWLIGVAFSLLAIWSGTLTKIFHDLQALQQQAAQRAALRANVYAEQVRRTVKEIDQISLTVKYQWEKGTVPLVLGDQYEKGMHHTPTYPVAIGADGKIKSSWRRASIGLEMGGFDFFVHHREQSGTELRINPPSAGIGGMQGKQTIRFTRRVSDAAGRFAGVVMVSTEPAYLASLDDNDDLNPGDFISVRLLDGPLLASKTVHDSESLAPYYRGIPTFETSDGVRTEPGEYFTDQVSRHLAWKKIDGYPLVALAGITESSAIKSYAPTRAAYLLFAGFTTVLLLLGAAFGCTAQIRSNERRRKAERVRATFRLAVDGAHEAFYMIEPIRSADGAIIDYRIEDCNERAAEMNHMPRQQIVGKRFSDLYEPSIAGWLLEHLNQAFQQNFLEDEFFVSEGSPHQSGWFQRRSVRSGDGIAVTIRDITTTKKHEEALARQALTDMLTGLPNRRWLNDYLPDLLARTRSTRNRIALLFIDLDNFKKINDTLGHSAGDELLRAAADCLRSAVRSSDHVIRLGGDEFTVLIENLERDGDAELIAAQVLRAFAESALFARWSALDVKCSIGIALYPEHAQDADRLLHCADEAMYAAKAAGKGQYRIFDPAVETNEIG